MTGGASVVYEQMQSERMRCAVLGTRLLAATLTYLAFVIACEELTPPSWPSRRHAIVIQPVQGELRYLSSCPSVAHAKQ